jgi:hypothetical protein
MGQKGQVATEGGLVDRGPHGPDCLVGISRKNAGIIKGNVHALDSQQQALESAGLFAISTSQNA